MYSAHNELIGLDGKPMANTGSRAEFLKFAPELPRHIQEELKAGKIRLADHVIYAIKPINSEKTVKIFVSQDIKEVGLTNISAGRLPKNMAMVVSGIIMLAGTAASADREDIKSTTFDSITKIPALTVGELTLKANRKQIVEDLSTSVFKTENLSNVPKGYYKLANPRLIHDDVDIEAELEFGSMKNVEALTYVFFALHGTVTIP